MIDEIGKRDLFGVQVSITNYRQAEEVIIQAAKRNDAALVDHMPVHGLMTAVSDKNFRNALNNFDMVCPDGHPVRWALNRYGSNSPQLAAG